MAKVKVSLMKDLEKQFEVELRQSHKEGVKKLMNRADNRIKDQLRNTLYYRFDSGTGAFTRTQPEAKIDIKTTVKGVSASYQVYMKDVGTGTPAYIWHLINGGRYGGILTKNIAFPVRNGNRTTPRDLNAGKFKGYSGGWVHMKQGERIEPIKARKWYMIAAQDFRKFAKTALFKELEFSKVEWQDW